LHKIEQVGEGMSCKGVTQEIRELVSELIDEKKNELVISELATK
jgi:hypothetical protein